MATARVRARAARDPLRPPSREDAPAAIATYLSDASRTPGGHAPRLYLPRDEGEVAWVLREEAAVLPLGAQSSLTGGGTPRGEALLTTSRMDRIGPVEGGCVRAQAGVPLLTLEAALREQGCTYPPTPTFTGAYVGGVVSTNAAGAATWKYGATRAWVEGLTVVLSGGDVLELRRGQVLADPAGWFEVELCSGEVRRVPVPSYTMPAVAKCSAGYYAAPGMDLVDLFVGAEGTLGVVTEASLRVLRDPPQLAVALLWVAHEAAALGLVTRLREASRATWAGGDPAGVDVRAIESMDRRCLELLREDGEDRRCGVEVPAEADTALLVQLELPAGLDVEASLAAYAEGEAPRDALGRFLALVEAVVPFERVELALPDDRARREQLFALREAVPMCVNHRVQRAQRELDPRIHKVAGDMIVPYERFPEMLAIYRDGFRRRGLDGAIWGHVSDGNVHPNLIPRSQADVEAGLEALLEFGREVARLGGCPLAEHGTGRSGVKQTLLRQLYGEVGLEEMRAVKRALDPGWRLAPGVIFPAPDPA